MIPKLTTLNTKPKPYNRNTASIRRSEPLRNGYDAELDLHAKALKEGLENLKAQQAKGEIGFWLVIAIGWSFGRGRAWAVS